MVVCDTFKEARKVARNSVKCHWSFLGKISKGYGKGKYLVDDKPFPEAEFYVHKDGRVCKIATLGKEKGHVSPFNYPRNRKVGENKQKYKKEMAIMHWWW